MAARSSAILLALVALGGAAGLVAASSKSTPGRGPSDAELTAIAGEIDARLRQSSGTVGSRAQTIAELQQVPSALGTNVETVRDMVKGKEIAFGVKKGQTIELGQVYKDGHETVLLRIPDSMTLSVPLSRVGQHLMVDSGKLVVAEVVQVTPPDAEIAQKLKGALSVSQEIDLSDLVDRLDKLGTAVRIELDGQPVVAGTRPMVTGATTREALLTSPMGNKVKVVGEVLPAQTSRNLGLLGGAVALALGGLGGALVLARRKSPDGAGAAAVALGSAPTGIVPAANPAGSGPRMTPTDAARLGVARTEISSTDVPLLGSGGSGSRLSTDARERSGATLQVGRFGRYKLVKQLGAGGMAEVYLATISGEAGFEKQVALKIMHANLATQEKVVDLFLDEARIVSRLTHPNIVQISDLGKDGTDYFIAMEFVDGWDLDKLVRAVRARGEFVPLRVGLTVLRKICDGLQAAHTAVDAEGKPLELVHRDVKAENVLVSRSGAVKVGDFGIAKANQQVHKTQLGELKGTAAYMAPEHRTGQAVDKRADIYGVGAIAYEVLTGNEVNLDLAMLAHLGREGWPHLPPPTSIRPDLPPELDAIVFKALAYDKDARYPTCESFEEALDAVASRLNLAASDKLVAQWVESVISSTPAASSGSTSAPGAAGGVA